MTLTHTSKPGLADAALFGGVQEARGAQRQGYHHPRSVLARGAVNQRRAPGLGDAAQRVHHLIGTVFQVTEVVPAGGIAREAGPVLGVLEQQRLG